MSVTLATTWLPRGELPRLQRYMPLLETLYNDILVVLASDADEAVRQALAAMPMVRVVTVDRIEQARMICIQQAVMIDADAVHYCDMDRLIRWVETRPDELKQTVSRIQGCDVLIIGRTQAAWDTHPRALHDTEAIILDVTEHALGHRWDTTAGSKGFSRAAAQFLAQHDTAAYGLGTDLTWPILLHRAGFTIEGVAVDGMDWETADRWLDHAADRETQRREAIAYDADPAHWVLRVDVARQIIAAGLHALDAPLPIPPRTAFSDT